MQNVFVNALRRIEFSTIGRIELVRLFKQGFEIEDFVCIRKCIKALFACKPPNSKYERNKHNRNTHAYQRAYKVYQNVRNRAKSSGSEILYALAYPCVHEGKRRTEYGAPPLALAKQKQRAENAESEQGGKPSVSHKLAHHFVGV